MKVESDKLGLTYIWQGEQENDIIRVSRINEGRCSYIDRIYFQRRGKNVAGIL